MCYNLVLVDIVGFVDDNFCIFKDAVTMLATWTISWCICTIITVVLAINHFNRAKRALKR